jgi:hypothetical protein
MPYISSLSVLLAFEVPTPTLTLRERLVSILSRTLFGDYVLGLTPIAFACHDLGFHSFSEARMTAPDRPWGFQPTDCGTCNTADYLRTVDGGDCVQCRRCGSKGKVLQPPGVVCLELEWLRPGSIVLVSNYVPEAEPIRCAVRWGLGKSTDAVKVRPS